MIREHKGKIAAGALGAAAIVGLILSMPNEVLDHLDPAVRDSALVNAVELTQRFEGLRLHPYYDQAGFATIAYGHKLSNTPYEELSNFDSVTVRQADSLLTVDLTVAIDCVIEHVTVSLTWNELAALGDFVFNLGCGSLQHSTLLRDLNKGRKHDVPTQLLLWDHAGGEELEGLRERREAEAKLWRNLHGE